MHRSLHDGKSRVDELTRVLQWLGVNSACFWHEPIAPADFTLASVHTITNVCLASCSSLPLVITGTPGIGKSALLCKFVHDFKKKHSSDDWVVVTHFFGADPESQDIHNVLRRLCMELDHQIKLVNTKKPGKKKKIIPRIMKAGSGGTSDKDDPSGKFTTLEVEAGLE